ncbi:SMI1/KNR4 family protein [Bradyrhizobium sp. INPA01-394B]|uniref:SMI1/KNR4 family protein n=1 Tax=Bradyrhizobium campsiandrae TaxID=1729892 RepID=A0ABR7TZR2_9BRAD|nr:SMI1/KNR4 family protein [Bradyrhizobium campsiandrae]MBC9877453.1 SMI1/KNR4 family protein [Bradyrhizobium campsiandrae]MBC9976828.1 SMI1/KNR4 family protein [Bradyrhizobium campsiandrae]
MTNTDWRPFITAQQIAELGQLVNRLRAIDRTFRVFGSRQHRYSFGPVLPLAEVRAFESNHGIDLPPDYHCFLTTVGNGGAGPYYGLAPLADFGRDLSTAFPFSQSVESIAELGQRVRGYELPGILEFCHQGCDNYSYLVVAGASYGTVWDGRPEDDDFRPTGLSFAAWYRHWAERVLRLLNNEHLVPLLRIGMTEADVNALVGGDWKKRQALSRAVWLFESSDIPAQLELDQRGIVTKVTPWSFIV